MPELPEIETVTRSLAPVLVGRKIAGITAYRAGLRKPFPDLNPLVGAKIISVTRRSKYVLIETKLGTVIIHLGMSGSVRWVSADDPVRKHDHWELRVGSFVARLNDPRRFGLVLFQPKNSLLPEMKKLGPEPLGLSFNGDQLKTNLANRKAPIKAAIMDASVVVGVGNIYATDSLFQAKIHPKTPANSLTLAQCNTLVGCIKVILERAIVLGGSTLRDFRNVNGAIGSYASNTQVYGKAGLPCPICAKVLISEKIAGRTTAWCSSCQKLPKPRKKAKLPKRPAPR